MQFKRITTAIRCGFNNRPWYLIFAITGRCNQRCAFCFYWKNIRNNTPDKELTINEVLLIAPQFDNLFQLTLSGGEPLLREDCLEIAKIFVNHTSVQRITLTSNGSMPNRIEKFVLEFCTLYPDINLSVNLSIDGLRETHDKIRGVPGAFEKFLESFDLLERLKKEYKNLDRATATTVSTQNQEEIFELLDFIESHLDISSHGLMLARGDISDPSLANVPIEKFEKMVFFLQEKSGRKTGLINRAIDQTYQKRRMDSITKKRMLDPCSAGTKLLVLNEYGMLTPCELLEPLRARKRLNYPFDDDDFVFGNLRDFDYDLNAIMNTSKARNVIKFIKSNGCWCTFECAMINNFFVNPRNYPKIAGKIFKESISASIRNGRK